MPGQNGELMLNRLVIVPVLLLAQIMSGCATTTQPSAHGSNPDAMVEAIAKAGESQPNNQNPVEKPISPTWDHYVGSTVLGSCFLVLVSPLYLLVVFGEVARAKTNAGNV